MSDAPIVSGASLDQLQEIPLPVSVSWMPQTIGWLFLLAALLIALALAGFLVWRRWRANQYRRDALTELTTIENNLRQDTYATLAQLPTLVKRTLLSVSPRTEVASQSGEQWLAYLDRTLPGQQFSSGPGRLLWRLAYAPEPALHTIPRTEIDALCALLRRWIQHHAAV